MVTPPVTLTAPEGGSATATVKLSTAPTADVTVNVSLGTNPPQGLAVSPTSLTFTTLDYANPKTLTFTSAQDSDAVDERVAATLTASGGGYAGRSHGLELVSQDDELRRAPTATIGAPGPNTVVTVTFSKAVGACPTVTQSHCSGTVTAFTDATVDDVFELVVARLDETNGLAVPADLEVGGSVPFTATISGQVATITPGKLTLGTADTSDDLDLAGWVSHLNLLVKDRYWSVDGGVVGSSGLKQLAVQSRPGGNDPPPSENSDDDRSPEPIAQGSGISPFVPDFDGQTLEVRHVTDDSTACLDVSGGQASNGRDVQTWDCNETDAQKWTLEKRTAGAYQGSYRLVSKLGNYCLDNRGDFSTSTRMGIWSCVSDTDGAAANQSVSIAASGGGYTLTFTNGGKSVWLSTDRSSGNPRGGANQTTVSGTAGASAVWQIGDSPVPAQPQPVLAGAQTLVSAQTPSFVGKTVTLSHVDGGTTGCLDVKHAAAQNGQNVQTWACNGTGAQKWRVEARTAGSESGRYRLVSGVGDGKSYCLDNRGDFKDSDRMDIWSCVADSHGAAANQSFDLTASGDGWILTFERGDASSMMWAERDTGSVSGNVGQRSGSASSRALWRIAEVRQQQPALSVSDPTVTEAAGATLAFTVSLDRAVVAGDGTVSVDYATRDGTATAGADYTAASGTLTFAVGESAKTVNVAVLDDSHDDDGETVDLVLSNATGASIADGTGTGTIANADAMPAAWLARFGRTVAEQVLDGVARRLEAARAPGRQEVVLAGQRLDLSGETPPGEAALAGVARAVSASSRNGPWNGNAGHVQGHAGTGMSGAHRLGEGRTMTGQEALLGSSFSLTGERDGSGGTLALWGRAARSGFAGEDGALSLDGDATTAMLGADYARDKWLAGLALAQSRGEGGYAGAGSGKVESSLTAAVPYAALRVTERLRLWGAAGFGSGGLTLRPADAGGADKPERIETDIDWTMVATGLRGDLLEPAGGAGPALALVSDALWARTESERTTGLEAAEADVTRLRFGLEGSWTVALDGGGTLVPKLEAGLRHDGGDAETGFGVEIGGGIAWTDPATGLALDVSWRTLLAHEEGGAEDWGFSAGLTFAPAAGRGPSLSLRHDVGAATTGGLDALFAPDPLAHRSGSDMAGRWTMEAAWGFPAFGGRFTGSPHVGVGLAETARDYTVGWRLAPGASPTAPDVSLGILATRRESGGGDAEHGIGLELGARW